MHTSRKSNLVSPPAPAIRAISDSRSSRGAAGLLLLGAERDGQRGRQGGVGPEGREILAGEQPAGRMRHEGPQHGAASTHRQRRRGRRLRRSRAATVPGFQQRGDEGHLVRLGTPRGPVAPGPCGPGEPPDGPVADEHAAAGGAEKLTSMFEEERKLTPCGLRAAQHLRGIGQCLNSGDHPVHLAYRRIWRIGTQYTRNRDSWRSPTPPATPAAGTAGACRSPCAAGWRRTRSGGGICRGRSGP